MALFTDVTELNRQGKYNAPERATGMAKTTLAAMGYDPSGKANTWGKVLNWIPGGSMVRNIGGSTIAKREGLEDVQQVIKGQRDEAFNKTMSTLALGVEGVKLAGGLGAGGAGMSALGNFGSGAMSALGGDIGGAVTSTLAGLDDAAQMQATKEGLQADVDALNTEDIMNKNPENTTPTDYQNYVSAPGATGVSSPESGAPSNGQKFADGLNKVDNFLGKLPMVGDAVNALVNYGVSSVALNKAGDEEYDKLRQSKTRMSSFSYL
jgi:hypothetical protein